MSRRQSNRKTRLFGTKRRSERGAALVEGAIVFLPLCIIIFGIIEYGFIFKDSLTLSSATRAGARTASAEPKSASFYTDTKKAVETAAGAAQFKNGDQLWIYKANASGNPTDSSCSTDCRRYSWNGSDFGASPSGGSGWDVNDRSACLGDADSVGIRLQLHHDAITGFFHNMVLTEKTVMRLEPQDSDCS